MNAARAERAPLRRPARHVPWPLAAAVVSVVLVVLLLLGAALGPEGVNVPGRQVALVVTSHVPGVRAWVRGVPTPEAEAIVWQVRLPRAASAALVGALLGMAGVALQGLLMNPLADPYTVGVSSGAAVGAALAEVTGFAALWLGFGGVGVAFATALAAVTLVYALARIGGRVSVHTFLLAGVVVGTFLWSLIPLLMVLADRAEDLQRVFFYLIGTLQGADWLRVGMLAPFAAASALLLGLWSRDLNLMTLGEETALHLGVSVESFKRRVLLVGSLATAAAVSVAGIIGFVGLVVPHVARRVVGPDHRALMPVAALLGAALLVAADMLVRVWLNDMPVGVVTAILGAPVFCLLLRRGRVAAW
ncbi:MAG: iron ABC transporter permease [Chthonomonadales bacterium]|nr:iron ABC transporter permease [Chthonomonadales bacterium]